MSLCDRKSMSVIHSLIPFPTGRGSVRPWRLGSHKGTYKGRLNLDTEMSITYTRDVHKVSFPLVPQPVNHLLREVTAYRPYMIEYSVLMTPALAGPP